MKIEIKQGYHALYRLDGETLAGVIRGYHVNSETGERLVKVYRAGHKIPDGVRPDSILATHPPVRTSNPLVRVKVHSPSQRAKPKGSPPSKRLVKRRKATQKAPRGYYANPLMMSEGGPELIVIQAQKPNTKTWLPIANFPATKFGADMAKQYARALGVTYPTWTIRALKI